MSAAREVRLLHRLQLAAHAAMKCSDQNVTGATGLTTAQLSVLTVVDLGRAVTQRDVAAGLGVNESAVTAMVRRLEAAGTLARTANPDDRRSWVLQLTPEGRAALVAGRKAFQPVNDVFEQALSADEIRTLADLLARLTEAFRDHPIEEGGSP